MDIQWRRQLGQGERALLRIPVEGATGVGCRLPSTFLVEGGIPGAACKEVAKGFVQVAQRLLCSGTLETSVNQAVSDCCLSVVSAADASW